MGVFGGADGTLELMRLVAAAVAAVVLFPASAQAAKTGVTWPEAREYTPGETARVKVATKRPVNVVSCVVSGSPGGDEGIVPRGTHSFISDP